MGRALAWDAGGHRCFPVTSCSATLTGTSPPLPPSSPYLNRKTAPMSPEALHCWVSAHHTLQAEPVGHLEGSLAAAFSRKL